MKTEEELLLMSQQERDWLRQIVEAARANPPQWLTLPSPTSSRYPQLSQRAIDTGWELLGVDIRTFYEQRGYFRAFKHKLIQSSMGLPPTRDGINYAMLWYGAVGEDGLRFIVSLPLLIAL